MAEIDSNMRDTMAMVRGEIVRSIVVDGGGTIHDIVRSIHHHRRAEPHATRARNDSSEILNTVRSMVSEGRLRKDYPHGYSWPAGA